MEVQVRVREAELYVRLDTAGGAEGMKNITYQTSQGMLLHIGEESHMYS